MDSSSAIQNLSTSKADEKDLSKRMSQLPQYVKDNLQVWEAQKLLRSSSSSKRNTGHGWLHPSTYLPISSLGKQEQKTHFLQKTVLLVHFLLKYSIMLQLFYHPLLHHPPSPRFPLNNWGLMCLSPLLSSCLPRLNYCSVLCISDSTQILHECNQILC